MINLFWLLGLAAVSVATSFVILYIIGLCNNDLDVEANNIFITVMVTLFIIIASCYLYAYSYVLTLPIVIAAPFWIIPAVGSLLFFVVKFDMDKGVNTFALFFVMSLSFIVGGFVFRPCFKNNGAEEFIDNAISSKLTSMEKAVYDYGRIKFDHYWVEAFFGARFCQDDPESKECDAWITSISEVAKERAANQIEIKKQDNLTKQRYEKAAELYKKECK